MLPQSGRWKAIIQENVVTQSDWARPKNTDAVKCHLFLEFNHRLLGNTSDDKPFYVYCKHLNRMVRVMVHLFVILCYQPDTAAHTKTSSGGRFHLDFGTSMYFLLWVKKYHAAHGVTKNFFHLHLRNLMIYKIVAVVFVLMPQELNIHPRFQTGPQLEINTMMELETHSVITKDLIQACYYAFDRISATTKHEGGLRRSNKTVDIFRQTFCVNGRLRATLLVKVNNKKDYILAKQQGNLKIEACRSLKSPRKIDRKITKCPLFRPFGSYIGPTLTHSQLQFPTKYSLEM